MPATIDVRIENHGSIILFHAVTAVACDWFEDNVQDDAQFWGDAVVVEPRYAHDLAEGLLRAGFEVA
jgi:hypothetical protein